MKIRSNSFILILAFSFAALLNSCNKESAASTTTGKGGSVTRFTIAGEYLYVVSNHNLYSYILSTPNKPYLVQTSPLNAGIETIYPFGKYLFLGTQTGLFIYSIDKPASPKLIGEANHARSCDPVVVNDSVAFVTLNSRGRCGAATSGLYVHDIKNITKPILKNTIELTDPVGLGLQDSILYVCDGYSGLMVFNVKNPYTPTLIATKTNDGKFIDVIPYSGNLICGMDNGISLYDITDPANPVFIKNIWNE
jgi:hypothetical protein